MVRRGEFCATLKKVRFCGILYVTNDLFKCYIKVGEPMGENKTCLLYTSDAADE